MQVTPAILFLILTIISVRTSANKQYKTVSERKLKDKSWTSGSGINVLEINYDRDSQVFLSGALLNKYWVLTQATVSGHITNLNSVDYIVVRLGLKDFHNFTSEHTTSEFYIHPRYEAKAPNGISPQINDLLLVKLQRPAILVEGKIKPIALPSRSDLTVELRGFMFRVVGINSTEIQVSEKPSKSTKLPKLNGTSAIERVEYRVLDNRDSACNVDPNNRFQNNPAMVLNDGQFCAISAGNEMDPSFRGAPVLWGSEDEPVLAGVYSHAPGAGAGSSGFSKRGIIFTRVAMYLEWIEQTTGIAIADS